MSYGFHQIATKNDNFKHVGAFDIDHHANATYSRNFGLEPSSLSLADARIVEIKTYLHSNGLKRNDRLIAIGCAPCQGFSSHRKKDKRKDNRNSLVGRFGEIAVGLNAEFVVMENVPDLLTKKHWKHYKSFAETLSSAGYKISAKIINMAEYGVPQERYRAVVLASRSGYPIFPKPSFDRQSFRTVREAIGHLTALSPYGGKDEKDPMHITSRHRKETVENIKKVPLNGGSRPRGVGPACLDRVEGFYDVYGRLHWDKPAVTITARCRTPSCGRFVHPEQHRGLSVREAGLLQGFPKDFIFEGPFDDKFKQIGNAVPPPFSTALASQISKLVNGTKGVLSDKPTEPEPKPSYSSYSSLIAHNKKVKNEN